MTKTVTEATNRMTYAPPSLSVFGSVAELTASGSGTSAECKNGGKPRTCNNGSKMYG